ncbi:DUF6884 domain-containing protein [Methanogenium organophilum]|uniref:DUF6884 domain-containing protein n=1 Tax=Methanogenium organophilum TaxID=2199 RepID=A0A9X9S3P0_METOG|nr:DUF6884 domain-containing protein [Methanogenium organophilum]WAI01364.1 hypothetical protein OU421_00370 [Methanogenium organophilum]
MTTLVIVPCGKAKIWDKKSELNFVAAKDAYTSTFFRLNRDYAYNFGDRWVILSAKYGFIDPDTMIEDYDISFNNKKTNPVSKYVLKEQILIQNLFQYNQIIGLGGDNYRRRISESFEDYQVDIHFPFKDCAGIGHMQRAIKNSIQNKKSSIK